MLLQITYYCNPFSAFVNPRFRNCTENVNVLSVLLAHRGIGAVGCVADAAGLAAIADPLHRNARKGLRQRVRLQARRQNHGVRLKQLFLAYFFNRFFVCNNNGKSIDTIEFSPIKKEE